MTMKENWLPHAKELERLIDVVIGPPVGEAGVIEVGVARVWAGVCIQTVGPHILRLRGEGVRELMLQSGEQHVVVRFTLTAEGIDAIHQRVLRRPLNLSQSGCVIVVQRVMTGTAYVA